MELVQGYKTIDGKFFHKEEEAISHERLINFLNCYKNLDKKPSISTGKLMAVWLIEHQEIVLSLLGKE